MVRLGSPRRRAWSGPLHVALARKVITVQIDFSIREITIKLVFYGPALSGKTTNLQALHRAADPTARGRLMTLETRDDRTLFFDLLPFTFRDQTLAVRLKVFTVPGQVIHASTRRLVVQGADGIVFVADSRVSETQANAESFLDLKNNLKVHGLDVNRMPVVIQFNKRDLPGTRSDAELAELAAQGREPVYTSIATTGHGVVETFLGILQMTCAGIEREHGLRSKFGFDFSVFLAEVARRLGETRSVAELVGTRLGGGAEPTGPGIERQ
jgi:signal recognition particle receptor subunit beta